MHMQIAVRHWVLALLLAVLAFELPAFPAAAQQQAPKAAQQTPQVNGPSDRTVRVMLSLAWDRMPAKIADGNETIEVDKSDPKKFLIPIEEARQVIVVANRTATAALCDMNDAVSANFIALMNAEEGSKRWTREQLHMIKWVHNAVVILRTANVEEKEAAAKDAQPKQPTEKMLDISEAKARARKEGLCTDERKAKLLKEIEQYVVAVSARYGKKVDKAGR